MPRRIQLSRARGFRLPPGVVVCARPTKWGNPFAIGERAFVPTDASMAPTLVRPTSPTSFNASGQIIEITSNEIAVDLHRRWMTAKEHSKLMGPPPDPAELAGCDLACWCGLDKVCHCDTLIELAEVAR